MLLSYTVKNWMHFHHPVTVSFRSSRERQHSGRLIHTDGPSENLIPVALMYGANGSGKTALINSIDNLRLLVVEAVHPALLNPRATDLVTDNDSKPLSYEIEIGLPSGHYRYKCATTLSCVLHESLHRISGTPQCLYQREAEILTLRVGRRGLQQQPPPPGLSLKQLAIQHEEIRQVYDWFAMTLHVIRYRSLFNEGILYAASPTEIVAAVNATLDKMGQEYIFELQPMHMSNVPSTLSFGQTAKGTTILCSKSKGRELLTVTRQNGHFEASILQPRKNRKAAVKESSYYYSEALLRLIIISPAFVISQNNLAMVNIIDDYGHSQHTLLAEKLLQNHLGKLSSCSRHQLLLATHNVRLMDQEYIRRDEIMVIDNNAGTTTITPISENRNIRYDKDICKSYLRGEYGGI